MRKCGCCGKKIPDDARFCPHCGKEAARTYEYSFSQSENSGFSFEEKEDKVQTWIKVMLILAAVCVPIVALISGIVFLSEKSAAYRRFGKTLIIISIVFMILSVAGVCAFVSSGARGFYGITSFGGGRVI